MPSRFWTELWKDARRPLDKGTVADEQVGRTKLQIYKSPCGGGGKAWEKHNANSNSHLPKP